MQYNVSEWYDAYLYMEEETGQGAFDNVSLEELRSLYSRCLREFAIRKKLAREGTVFSGWNDAYASKDGAK